MGLPHTEFKRQDVGVAEGIAPEVTQSFFRSTKYCSGAQIIGQGGFYFVRVLFYLVQIMTVLWFFCFKKVFGFEF